MMNRKAIRKKSVIVLMVVLQIMPKVIVKVLGQQNVKREFSRRNSFGSKNISEIQDVRSS